MFKSVAAEVKAEILAKVKSGESVMSLASLYGVSDKTIYNWLRKKALGSVSLVEHNRIRKENQQLKQIIGVLTFEIEKFKKKTI